MPTMPACYSHSPVAVYSATFITVTGLPRNKYLSSIFFINIAMENMTILLENIGKPYLKVKYHILPITDCSEICYSSQK
jgi:hypothetical protein